MKSSLSYETKITIESKYPESKPVSRIRYIDAVKGITILWVVLMHLEINPSWPEAATQMGIFFLISGMFFKPQNFKKNIKKKYQSLLIPLLWFWLISWMVMLLKVDLPEYIHNGTFAPDKTFDFINRYSYLRVNILWFLMALFATNIFYNGLCNIIKEHKILWLIAISGILYLGGCYITGHRTAEGWQSVYDNPYFPLGPFLINQVYFVIGFLFSKALFKYNGNPVISLLLLISYSVICKFIPLPFLILLIPYTILMFMVISSFSKRYDRGGNLLFRFFIFCGENSIIIYLTHMLFIYSPVAQHIIYSDILSEYMNRWIVFVMIIILELPIIYFFNKYLPSAVGKKLWSR